jgi:hypothetical protein
MLRHAGCKIPYSDISVATSTDESITIRNHSPDTHDMTLQTALMAAFSVKDVNLCIVKRDNNVFVGQM